MLALSSTSSDSRGPLSGVGFVLVCVATLVGGLVSLAYLVRRGDVYRHRCALSKLKSTNPKRSGSVQKSFALSPFNSCVEHSCVEQALTHLQGNGNGKFGREELYLLLGNAKLEPCRNNKHESHTAQTTSFRIP